MGASRSVAPLRRGRRTGMLLTAVGPEAQVTTVSVDKRMEAGVDRRRMDVQYESVLAGGARTLGVIEDPLYAALNPARTDAAMVSRGAPR